MHGRTTLASLAGSALAVVSAGVLVAFSLTAQRASLDPGLAGRPDLRPSQAQARDHSRPIQLADVPDGEPSSEPSPAGATATAARATFPGSLAAAVIETVLAAEAVAPRDGGLTEVTWNRGGGGTGSGDPGKRDFPTFGNASSPALQQEVELRSSDIVAAFAPPPLGGDEPGGGTGADEDEDASEKAKKDEKPPKDKGNRPDKPSKPHDNQGGRNGHDDDGHRGNGHEHHGNGNGTGHDEDGGDDDGNGHGNSGGNGGGNDHAEDD